MDLAEILLASVRGQVDDMCADKGQFALGQLLSELKRFDDNKEVRFKGVNEGYPSNYHSYRGYYRLIALEPSDEPILVSDLVEMTCKAIGNTYTGYKGGQFAMTNLTTVWVSNYGTASGYGITNVEEEEDTVYLIVSEIEDYI